MSTNLGDVDTQINISDYLFSYSQLFDSLEERGLPNILLNGSVALNGSGYLSANPDEYLQELKNIMKELNKFLNLNEQ